MRDDENDDDREDLSDEALHSIEGGIRFGEYSVVSPGVQIVIGGRPISHPGD